MASAKLGTARCHWIVAVHYQPINQSAFPGSRRILCIDRPRPRHHFGLQRRKCLEGAETARECIAAIDRLAVPRRNIDARLLFG